MKKSADNKEFLGGDVDPIALSSARRPRRRRVSANILLLPLLNNLRLYADGDGGGGEGDDVANQTAGYRKPDCPE